MTTTNSDPFAKFKAAQREAWAAFGPVEISTTIPAAKLVKFAQVKPGQKVTSPAEPKSSPSTAVNSSAAGSAASWRHEAR